MFSNLAAKMSWGGNSNNSTGKKPSTRNSVASSGSFSSASSVFSSASQRSMQKNGTTPPGTPAAPGDLPSGDTGLTREGPTENTSSTTRANRGSSLFRRSGLASSTPPPSPPPQNLEDVHHSKSAPGAPPTDCPKLGIAYFVTIHEIHLTKDIASAHSTVYIECGGAKCHIPVQDCFRKYQETKRKSMRASLPEKGGENNTPPPTLRIKFAPLSPFVDLHFYVTTEGILSTEVSGQATIPLSPIFCEDHHERCAIEKRTLELWYFKGKLLGKYQSGIPEVPTSALKLPKKVGYVVVSVTVKKPMVLQDRMHIYLDPTRKHEDKPNSNLNSIDEIEEKIFRILRVYERFLLRAQTAPWWLESVFMPLITFEQGRISLAVMAILAISCLTTPAHLLPMDWFLALFVLSIYSKAKKSVNCICWSDDPRLREPEGTPHSIVGQFFYAKKVLDQFVQKVETAMLILEMLPTSLDWTDPLVTLVFFGIFFASLYFVCIVIHIILILHEAFLSLRVVLLAVLWAPFIIGFIWKEKIRRDIEQTTTHIASKYDIGGEDVWEVRKERLFAFVCAKLELVKTIAMKLPSIPEQEHRHIAAQQEVDKSLWKKTDEKLYAIPLPLIESKGGRDPPHDQRSRNDTASSGGGGVPEEDAGGGGSGGGGEGGGGGAPSSRPTTPSDSPALTPPQNALNMIMSPLGGFGRRRGRSNATERSDF